jgi:hypothetical protein
MRHHFSLGLPVILALSTFASPVWAETVGAQAAAQLLAKTQVVDAKCHYLASSQHDELSSLVARAEVALASQSDVASTKSTMAAGRAAGRSALCNEVVKAEVESVLAVAMQAAQAAPSAVNNDQAQGSSVTISTQPMTPKAEPFSPAPKRKISGGLETYAAMTERYYRARRCFSMPRGQMNSFYQEVVATHHVMVKTYGVKAVAAVMHQSESSADHQGCG